MARVLCTTPLQPGAAEALRGHHVEIGPPGSDPAAAALICTPVEPVSAAAIAAMPALRVICVAGAGTDAVDGRAAAARGIEILASPEPLVETTADVAFGLIIAAARRFTAEEQRLRSGGWRGWEFMPSNGALDVHGAALGLVGFGRIARAVARRAAGFAMQVRHHTRTDTGEPGWTEDLDELLAVSDIVSLHVPLTDTTRGLIDARRLALMAPHAVLVNTARGQIVDDAALAAALRTGRLGGAGLDVFDGEPAVRPELLAAPNATLLPHIGSATERSREAMLTAAAERAAAALAS